MSFVWSLLMSNPLEMNAPDSAHPPREPQRSPIDRGSFKTAADLMLSGNLQDRRLVGRRSFDWHGLRRRRLWFPQPITDMVDDPQKALIADPLAVVIADVAGADVPHDPLYGHEIQGLIGDRLERVPQRVVGPSAGPAETQAIHEGAHVIRDRVGGVAVLEEHAPRREGDFGVRPRGHAATEVEVALGRVVGFRAESNG